MSKGLSPEKGRVYRITSRNIPYGVYIGAGEFIGIREKFGTLFLSTENANVVREDLGLIPDGIELCEGNWPGNPEPGNPADYRQNEALYAFLARIEQSRDRVDGYGARPGDPE